MVGYAQTTGNAAYHAFLYEHGAMTDLGTLGGTRSFALGVSAAGQVVGYAQTTGDAVSHAFLYEGGVMLDLNDLIDPLAPLLGQFELFDARAINSFGDIAATGVIDGRQHAFLLTRIETPEPAALGLLRLGFVALLCGRRRVVT